jgi:hypothetical protein
MNYLSDKRENLKGSPALDAWMWIHKKFDPKLSVVDSDMIILFNSHQFPIAACDFKAKGTDQSLKNRDRWATCVNMNHYLSQGLPFYIIAAIWHEDKYGMDSFTDIEIRQVVELDSRNARYQTKPITTCKTLRDYEAWEKKLRESRRLVGGSPLHFTKAIWDIISMVSKQIESLKQILIDSMHDVVQQAVKEAVKEELDKINRQSIIAEIQGGIANGKINQPTLMDVNGGSHD